MPIRMALPSPWPWGRLLFILQSPSPSLLNFSSSGQVSLTFVAVVFPVAKLCPSLLWPHGLQYARPPCPSLSPRVCPSSCPLNGWCYPTIFRILHVYPPSVAEDIACCQGLFIVSTPSGWGSLKKVLWTFLFCIHPQCSWPESVRELVQVRETGLNCQTMMGLEADVSELWQINTDKCPQVSKLPKL